MRVVAGCLSSISGGYEPQGHRLKAVSGDPRKDFSISLKILNLFIEKAIAENQDRHSGLVTAKDIFVVICGVGALIVLFVRLTLG